MVFGYDDDSGVDVFQGGGCRRAVHASTSGVYKMVQLSSVRMTFGYIRPRTATGNCKKHRMTHDGFYLEGSTVLSELIFSNAEILYFNDKIMLNARVLYVLSLRSL